MSPRPSSLQARTERASLLDGAFYSLMVGTGETYLVAFALALGVSERAAALLGIVPIILGAMANLGTGRGAAFFGSLRRWVIFCASVQATAVLAFVLAPSTGGALEFWLFGAATLYWSAGLAAGPPWNAWLGQLIPGVRQRYFFVKRTVVAQGGTLAALLASGLLLRGRDPTGTIDRFLLLFVAAGIFRILSVHCLWRHPEAPLPPPAVTGLRAVTPWLKKPLVRTGLAFTFLTAMSVHVSASFFTPYMLKHLQLDYLHFTWLLAVAFLAKMGTTYVLRGFTRRYGVQALFIFGAFTIIPLPGLWVLGDSYVYLVFLQLLSGWAWGSHELGLTLFLFEAVGHDERSRLLTWTNAASSVGMLVGIAMGWWLAGQADPSKETYHVIFLVSSVMRMVPLLLLAPFVQAISPSAREVGFRTLGLRPAGIGLLKPLLLRKSRTATRPPPS